MRCFRLLQTYKLKRYPLHSKKRREPGYYKRNQEPKYRGIVVLHRSIASLALLLHWVVVVEAANVAHRSIFFLLFLGNLVLTSSCSVCSFLRREPLNVL